MNAITDATQGHERHASRHWLPRRAASAAFRVARPR